MSLSFVRHWWNHQPPAGNTPRNPAEPVEAEAQFRLGLAFASAKGDAQDYVQAAHWYGKAAVQNHPLAQFNLAVMHAHGQGVPRDEASSLVWLHRAANLGDAGAQYTLGVRQHLTCRNASEGTSGETRIEALKWVRLSAAQGYRGAEQACEFVTLAMTRQEVTEAERRVAAFHIEPTPATQTGAAAQP